MNLCVPATLLLNTPDTSALERIEAFVHPSLDTANNRPLLQLLGARTEAVDATKLLGRLRALTTIHSPPVAELAKLYDALDRIVSRMPTKQREDLKAAFSEYALIYGNDDLWHPTPELYISTEEIPGLPVIREEWTHLSLWNRIGVALRPTTETAIEWLRSLAPGQTVDLRMRGSVSAILARVPQMVWEQTGCWLDLAGCWRAHSDMDWSTCNETIAPTVFQWVRERTADLSMLGPRHAAGLIFNKPSLLENALSWRVHDLSGDSGATGKPPWLHGLAKTLLRISPSFKDTENGSADVADAISTALDLLGSQWHPVDGLQVTPYLMGQPAGDSQRPSALWSGSQIYVVGESPHHHRELVKEIAGRFQNPDIREVVADCIGRDIQWIKHYVSDHLPLLPEGTEEVQTRLQGAIQGGTGHGEGGSAPLLGQIQSLLCDEDGAEDDIEPGSEYPACQEAIEKSPEQKWLDPAPAVQDLRSYSNEQGSVRGSHTTIDGLFRTWATARGFSWRHDRKMYTAADGRRICKDGGLFHWTESKHTGEVLARYWIANRTLQQGVDLPAAIWEALRSDPTKSSLLLPQPQGELDRYVAVRLQEMVKCNMIQLHPARYLLRTEEASWELDKGSAT